MALGAAREFAKGARSRTDDIGTLSTKARARPRTLASRALESSTRVAPFLLPHVSLLLALVGGAGLATSARLKWDPSTYIAVRELFPVEYRVVAVALCVGSGALLALAHVAALALTLPLRVQAARRALLLAYAVAMCVLVCAEVAWAAWMVARLVGWMRAHPALLDAARALQDSDDWWLRLIYNLLPDDLQDLIEEAKEDVPCNLYVGASAVLLVGALQPAAVLLALLSARPRPPARAQPSLASVRCDGDSTGTDSDKTPFQLAFNKWSLAAAV